MWGAPYHPPFTRTERCGQPVAPFGSGGLISSGATVPSPSVARISMFAAGPGRLEWEDPAHPGEIGVDRWLQGGVSPGRALVETDLHPVDAAIPGGGHPGRDRRSSGDFLASGWGVDATPDLVRGGITPTACLPVALVVIVDRFDPLDPLDVLHPVDRRHDQPRRETVVRWQRLAIHAGHQQRRRMHRLRQRDRVVIAVGGAEDDVDRLRVHSRFFQ